MTQDLAYRRTRRKHSPTEASIARASIVAEGGKPTKDAIADDSLPANTAEEATENHMEVGEKK